MAEREPVLQQSRRRSVSGPHRFLARMALFLVLVIALAVALGRPLAFAWLALAELGLVAALAVRREALVRGPHNPRQEIA